MADKAFAGIVAVRSNATFLTPPGLLGYNHLIVPDEFTDSQGQIVRTWKLNLHLSDAAIKLLVSRIDKQVVDAMWLKFRKEASAKGFDDLCVKEGRQFVHTEWLPPSAHDWVENQLTPSQAEFSDLPFITFKNKADYVDKQGQVQTKKVRATDATGEIPLDLASLNLGRGSTVQAMLTPGIYASAILNGGVAQISVKLQGVQVIKLERFGGRGEGTSEEDMSVVGDVKADDLSAYMRKPSAPATEERATRESPTGERYSADLDEEIPF